MKEKTVTTINGDKRIMLRANNNFMACACCDNPVHRGQYYTVCDSCGGIFCENCVINARFDKHNCEEEDDEEEEE